MKYYSINSKAFPAQCGIYFVCRIDRKILYIGVTDNVNRRLSLHEKFFYFMENKAHYYYIIFFKDVELAFKYELKYIDKYKPPLNVIIRRRYKSKIKPIELDPHWLVSLKV